MSALLLAAALLSGQSIDSLSIGLLVKSESVVYPLFTHDGAAWRSLQYGTFEELSAQGIEHGYESERVALVEVGRNHAEVIGRAWAGWVP